MSQTQQVPLPGGGRGSTGYRNMSRRDKRLSLNIDDILRRPGGGSNVMELLQREGAIPLSPTGGSHSAILSTSSPVILPRPDSIPAKGTNGGAAASTKDQPSNDGSRDWNHSARALRWALPRSRDKTAQQPEDGSALHSSQMDVIVPPITGLPSQASGSQSTSLKALLSARGAPPERPHAAGHRHTASIPDVLYMSPFSFCSLHLFVILSNNFYQETDDNPQRYNKPIRLSGPRGIDL